MDLQIHLTNQCNLRCKHCYNQNTGVHLTSAQFDYILNEVLGYMRVGGARPGRVTYCGGEPTMSPILTECMRKCTEAGFQRIALLTNGVLVQNEFAQELVQAGCGEVQICIEGNEATHNEIRGGTWGQVLKAWETCRRHGMRVTNQTTIGQRNYRQIEDVINTCRDRVHYTRFLRQIPHDARLGFLTAAEWLEAMDRFYHAYYRQNHRDRECAGIKDIYWSHIFGSMNYRCPFNSPDQLPLVTVECNGDVYVCRRSNIVLGNLFQAPLTTLFAQSDILSRTWKANGRTGRCAECAERAWCGGCRGMALAVNGDILAEDPHCVLGSLVRGLPRNGRKAGAAPPPRRAASELPGAEATEVLDYLKIAGQFAPALREVRARKVTVEAAREEGLEVSTEELQRAADLFRSAQGLGIASDTERWLESMGLSLEAFEEYLEQNILIAKFKDLLEQRAREEGSVAARAGRAMPSEMIYLAWLKSALAEADGTGLAPAEAGMDSEEVSAAG